LDGRLWIQNVTEIVENDVVEGWGAWIAKEGEKP